LMANVSDFNPATDTVPDDQLLEIDRFALARAAQLQADIRAHFDVYEFHPVVSKLQIYCSEDLGAFYLDVLKDRLYTTAPKSLARRSAQTALYRITHGMLRWMAPFLSFTAEEAWTTFGTSESIFLETFSDFGTADEALLAKWGRIREIRDGINKLIELQRSEGKIGASLQAEITLFAGTDNVKWLEGFGEDLKYVLITSKVTIKPYTITHGKILGQFIGTFGPLTTDPVNHPSIQCHVSPSSRMKCERCWHYCDDVGVNNEHPTICGRCFTNLFGSGEDRKVA
jgi:isoleucyl-tRNA synthetase